MNSHTGKSKFFVCLQILWYDFTRAKSFDFEKMFYFFEKDQLMRLAYIEFGIEFSIKYGIEFGYT